jgi:hypothetical protein
MGCHHWNLPTFVSSGTWHRQGTTFLGLYGSWNSPALPEDIGERNTVLLGKKLLDNMTQLFKKAFLVGFDSSNFDHFYLLFVAWNGLDQIPPRDPKESIEQDISSSSLPKSPEDYSNKILQLRDEVCALYGDNSMSSDRLKVYLTNMITNANILVDHIASVYVPDDTEMIVEIPLPVTALLAAVPSYISAGVAGFTMPGNDYFSRTMSRATDKSKKRQRGYSSESEPPHMEHDSDSDSEDYESDVCVEAWYVLICVQNGKVFTSSTFV